MVPCFLIRVLPGTIESRGALSGPGLPEEPQAKAALGELLRERPVSSRSAPRRGGGGGGSNRDRPDLEGRNRRPRVGGEHGWEAALPSGLPLRGGFSACRERPLRGGGGEARCPPLPAVEAGLLGCLPASVPRATIQDRERGGGWREPPRGWARLARVPSKPDPGAAFCTPWDSLGAPFQPPPKDKA